jgi:adenylate cyclase
VRAPGMVPRGVGLGVGRRCAGFAVATAGLTIGDVARIGAAMTARDFEAAGLYDPSAPNAAERLALLEWLVARGVTREQMVEANAKNVLSSVASDLILRPGPYLSARDVAARAGVDVEYIMRLSLAAGLPPKSADDPIYDAGDVRLFAASISGPMLFGEERSLRFTRVVGSSLARVAEAAVSMFQVALEGPAREAGKSELAMAQQSVRGIESLDTVRTMLQDLFTAQVATAIRRFREARPRRSADTATMAVGFVDLVGFTTLAHRVSTSELAAVVERFEDAAYDIASAHDGRVVKLVGDEVMFVTRDPSAACEVALSLVERFAGDASVTPRGGIAHGELLLRGGDYYGPVVNLAARVAQIAVPSEMLVTADVAAAAAGSRFRFEPAGRRMLKGFDAPVTLLTVERASALSIG